MQHWYKKWFTIKHIAVGLLLLAFIVVHEIVIYKNFLIDNTGSIRTQSAGYWDLAFHLSQISKFAFLPFDLNEPIFSETPLRYSFLVNWLSGILLKITTSWEWAFNIPLMISVAVSAVLLYFIYKKVLDSSWKSLLALLLFYFGSGLGIFAHYKTYVLNGSNGWLPYLQHIITNNGSTLLKWGALYPEQNIVWGSPLSLAFSHQRSFILGFALFAIAICTYVYSERLSKYSFIIIGALALGLSPIAHIHTFVTLFGITGLFGLYYVWQKQYAQFKRIVIVLVVGLIIALPQLYFFTNGANVGGDTQSFIHARLGWMAQPTIGSVNYPENATMLQKISAYTNFTWINLGLQLPLFILAGLGLLAIAKSAFKKTWALWWVCAGSLLVLLHTIQFQPWDFDNNKFLVYFAFFASPVIVGVATYGIQKMRLHAKIIASVLFGCMILITTISGLVDVLPRLYIAQEKQPVLFTESDFVFAEYIRKEIPQSALILTSTSTFNPVVSLAGRPVLMGYPGWLWTKGVNVSEREADIKNFYRDPVAYRSVLEKYNIDYIALDQMAQSEWGASKLLFGEQFQYLFQSGNTILYKVE